MEISGFKFLCVDGHEDLLKETYRLRYQVYCHEAEFLDDSEYPDEIESDIYDKHSVHFAALDHEKKIVGNYGEMFERNLGEGSPLKLERGMNRLYDRGGLMYSPSF